MKTTGAEMEENGWLKRQFTAFGLDPTAVWAPTPGDVPLENRQLRQLLHWVLAYRTWPSREELVKRGYEFPPVEPDIDPECDWLRFERWMQGRATTWRASDVGIRFHAPEALSDDVIKAEVARITERLAERNVLLDLQDGIPVRRVYEYLRKALSEAEFEFLAPDTFCHLDGCDGDCAACFQRQWCELGSAMEWEEEARAAS